MLPHAKAIEKVGTHAKGGGTDDSWSGVTKSKERCGTVGLVGPIVCPDGYVAQPKTDFANLHVCVDGLMHGRMGSWVKIPQVDTA
jgi:hypothetical protein